MYFVENIGSTTVELMNLPDLAKLVVDLSPPVYYIAVRGLNCTMYRYVNRVTYQYIGATGDAMSACSHAHPFAFMLMIPPETKGDCKMSHLDRAAGAGCDKIITYIYNKIGCDVSHEANRVSAQVLRHVTDARTRLQLLRYFIRGRHQPGGNVDLRAVRETVDMLYPMMVWVGDATSFLDDFIAYPAAICRELIAPHGRSVTSEFISRHGYKFRASTCIELATEASGGDRVWLWDEFRKFVPECSELDVEFITSRRMESVD